MNSVKSNIVLDKSKQAGKTLFKAFAVGEIRQNSDKVNRT